jgi:hypothetical protein
MPAKIISPETKEIPAIFSIPEVLGFDNACLMDVKIFIELFLFVHSMDVSKNRLFIMNIKCSLRKRINIQVLIKNQKLIQKDNQD